MLRDSVVAVVVVHTHPRAIPLAMISMRKSTDGFHLFSYRSMGLPLAALWAAGAPQLLLYGKTDMKKMKTVMLDNDFAQKTK